MSMNHYDNDALIRFLISVTFRFAPRNVNCVYLTTFWIGYEMTFAPDVCDKDRNSQRGQ